MKSSTGKYFLGLDQIRGVAVFIVFVWHFIHVNQGHKSGPIIFPLNILAEGHTGVALFMALSGYLFAKLLEKKQIIYRKFMKNRAIRLLPLLALVIFIDGVVRISNGTTLLEYIQLILLGIAIPTLPNGGWSITVEFHFYIILPLLFYIGRKWNYGLFGVLFLTLIVRIIIYYMMGQVQDFSYWTILGRIDQFLLGILAFWFREHLKSNKIIIVLFSLFFLSFYYYFDYKGGFYSFSSYPSPSWLWIIIPTIEGCFYALVIVWYDYSSRPSNSLLGKLFAQAGKYSYSIYLLHFFFVFEMAQWINDYLVDLSNIYITMLLSIPCFLIMIPLGYLSFRFIEMPFLKYRANYLKSTKVTLSKK